MTFNLTELEDYAFDKNKNTSTPVFQAVLQNAEFLDSPDVMAFLGCGGTISSAYSPSQENISPTKHNPAFETLRDLQNSFGVSTQKSTRVSLFSKDSRDVNATDIKFLLDVINAISNKRIVVTCGTYLLPLITQALDTHLCTPNKLVGVTGSVLTSAHKDHDVDFNAGAVITTLNALDKNGQGTEKPFIFASFHGDYFQGEDLKSMNLHPNSHKNKKLYRGVALQ